MPAVTTPSPVVEPTPLSPEEKLAASLEAMRMAIREKARADNAELQTAIKVAEHRLQEAEALAGKLGITVAVSELCSEMQHWHAWSKNERFGFSKNLVEGLAYIDGSLTRVDRNSTTWNEFVFNGSNYRLTVEGEHFGFDSVDIYASLVLETHEGTVFRSDVVKDGSKDLAKWRTLHVTAFNIGDWVQDLVMLHELIRNRQQRNHLEFKAKYILPKAKDLPANLRGEGSDAV